MYWRHNSDPRRCREPFPNRSGLAFKGVSWTTNLRCSTSCRIERPAEAEPAAWPKWVAVAVVARRDRRCGHLAAVAERHPGARRDGRARAGRRGVGPGTILDASGYVVARRQATVSSKITGKVVQVAIEEGQRVERDEVIARLDDTNARAAAGAGARAARASRSESHRGARRVRQRQADVQRNEQQLAKAVISAQTFDTAKAAYDAARTGLDVATRARRGRATRASRSPSATSTTRSCARRSRAS